MLTLIDSIFFLMFQFYYSLIAVLLKKLKWTVLFFKKKLKWKAAETGYCNLFQWNFFGHSRMINIYVILGNLIDFSILMFQFYCHLIAVLM